MIDARGHRCPVPTLRLRRALETASEVTLIADDPMARIDVPHFATTGGHVVRSMWEADGALTFVIARKA